jgi:hypothetical protein
MQKIKRIYHTWDKWECYPAGFYENSKTGMNKQECEKVYKDFLSNLTLFEASLKRVITEWKNSCEHYLTNEKMNRIAWLGQSSLCIETGIPSCFRSGYFLLSKDEQAAADNLALKYLNIWLEKNNYPQTDLEGAGVSAQANIY